MWMILLASQAMASNVTLRGGTEVSMGHDVAGPGVMVEGHTLGDAWVAGVRGTATRRAFLGNRSVEVGAELEAGRVTPVNRFRLQGTVSAGATRAERTDTPWCLSSSPCTGPVTTVLVRPTVGGSVGVLSRSGNVWVGLRGKLGVPSVGLGVTAGLGTRDRNGAR